ncbi:MAG: PhoH family protein [Sphaerochaetaceae bacterium]|nr:PhoH family protein [Sphaerochaetaceae bacterium]
MDKHLANCLYFGDINEMGKVLGANDRNLSYLELLLGVEMSVKGNMVSFNPPSEIAIRLLERLQALSHSRDEEFSQSEIFMEYQLLSEPKLKDLEEGKPLFSDREYSIIVNSRSVFAKSRVQKKYVASLFENQITFSEGPAGTGKTFLAIAYALMQLLNGKKHKLVLTRPVVEAGESLGFLPGDLSQKLNPYLKPLYDSMEYFLTPSQIKKLEETGAIEISPLAYMRGRSLNRSIVILDEAQNTTRGQMKMFLTRLGEDSQAIITGDASQIDLPGRNQSGLVEALSILHDISGLGVVRFSQADVVRSRIVKAIISRYSEEDCNEHFEHR